MVAIKFDFAAVACAESPIESLADAPVPIFHTAILRIALATLAITGVLATLVAIQATNADAAFSCALSASVNFVACAHYYYILKVREEDPRYAFLTIAHGRIKNRELGKETIDKNNKMFLQECATESLRFSDWAVCNLHVCRLEPFALAPYTKHDSMRKALELTLYTCAQVTLPIMALDLMDLTYHATGGVEPFIDKYLTAAMLPLMVLFGGFYRFYANEVNGNIMCVQLFVGAVSYTISCVIFGVVVTTIINPITLELCPTGVTPTEDNKCPITDPKMKHEANAVMILTLVWIGYPVVSIMSRLYIFTYGFAKPALISAFNDLAYAVLDVVSKAGLALYVCYRTKWL